jgi:hypothetical protein
MMNMSQETVPFSRIRRRRTASSAACGPGSACPRATGPHLVPARRRVYPQMSMALRGAGHEAVVGRLLSGITVIHPGCRPRGRAVAQ